MAMKLLILSVLFICLSFEASSQFVYKNTTAKKITKKEYQKLLLQKREKDRQKRSRPFVYMYT
jgi:hypothetical protein